MQINVLPVGSLVYVTSYGPFRGLRGTIQAVNTIADELEEPFCFYHIALEAASTKEPIWFAYDEVEVVAPASDGSSMRLERENAHIMVTGQQEISVLPEKRF